MLVRFCMNRVGVLVGREESFACCIRAWGFHIQLDSKFRSVKFSLRRGTATSNDSAPGTDAD